MASLRVLSFDPEGRPVAFDTWHDDMELYLLSDLKDSVSLNDHVSGAAPAPPATADVSTRSQWLSSDATARLAIRNHLPATECAHFGEHRTAQALYDAVVACYCSPATAAIGSLLLPYLFLELSAFATVADLVTHLRTSDARYRAAVPAEFLPMNQPPMFITLYFIVTRLPDSLRSVRDHFLTLDPTSLTVDLLEQHILAAETSAVADVGAASTSAKCRNSKGKGGRGSGGGSGGGGGGSGSGSGGSGRGGGGGGGGGGSGGGGGGSGGSGGSGGGGTGGGRSGPRRGGPSGGRGQQQQLRSENLSPQQLHDAEGDCYRCVSPDPGIAAATLGASVSGTPSGTAPVEALHTFTLDSGASRCFFRDSTTLTPLPALVLVRVADPYGGPVVARSSTFLPCPAVPFGSLSGLHLPSFSTNLVSTAALQDAMVTTTTPGGSSLYTLATEPPQVAASTQVSASGQVAASCSCCLLLHQTLLWHHRLGHPSLPRLRGMHSRLLVSGLPRSLPPLPPSPAPPCLPCVEGRQCAAPHSSLFPPTSAPLRTLHMDDLVVLRLHSDRGGEFSSDLLRDFCRGEGITQSFTLPDSPQQNGIAERRIGLVMEVARTSMIHVAAPHFLWPFAVRYAAHQLNLLPRVSLPETSPTLRWTGKVGDASVFRVWGSRAFVRDTSADKLSARAIPCVFLGFVPDAPGGQFYHPTSRCLLPSQDVTFDESVPFYHLFPYRSAPPPPLPLFLTPGPPPVDPLPPQGPAPSGVSPVDPLSGTVLVQVAVVSGAAPCSASGGAEREGVEPGGAESEGAETVGAEPRGAALSTGPAGALPRLSLQQLHEWLVRRPHRRSGAPGAGGAGDTGVGGAAVPTGAVASGGVGCDGAGDPTEPGAAGAVGAGAGIAGVGGPGAGGAGAVGAGVGGTGAGGELVAIYIVSRTGEHLATFTRRPGYGLYTLIAEPTLVAASVEVTASFSCRLLMLQTLLWHHRLDHPSLPRLCGMHSCLLVSGLPRSLPPLPRSLVPPCLPCVEGRQQATPHSSSFPPTTAPLQTLHMDAEVRSVLIRWIRVVRRQLSARFQHDVAVLRLHSDRGGEFSSGLLEDFCGAEGIRQTFTLPASPQQNGIAMRRIGLVMEVARTSIVHAAAPHFLWPFAVQYATKKLNLWPRVSHLETSPTLRWTGEVGDASAFRFYHPGSCHVLSSKDVTFDDSVCFYPHCSSPVPLSPLAL
ncbi:unnamed protein product, partial [Closterium sp. NIES-53]